MTSTSSRAPRRGTTYRPRLTGRVRDEMAARLAAAYHSEQLTVRELAARHGLSYGTTHLLLREAGTVLRPRGSGHR